jgi:peptidoglycan/xylan/chitin deacetylase (PgdA/CDA1 family)
MIEDICENEMEGIDSTFAISMQSDTYHEFRQLTEGLKEKSVRENKRKFKKTIIAAATLASLLFPVASSRTQDIDLDLVNYKHVLQAEQQYSSRQVEQIYDTGIPIIMLHYCMENSKLSREARKYNITPEKCREMLEFLHENNYVLISAKEYAEKDLSAVPKGKWPAVITFDDSSEGQFMLLLDKEGNPTRIDPNSCVGIINNFYYEHPDFRRKATFFINFYGDPKYGTYSTFRQEGFEDLKLKLLYLMGYDIQSHGYAHINMGSSTDKKVLEDLDRFKQELEKHIPVNDLKVIAWPYGNPPSKNVIEALKEKGYGGASNASGGIAKGDPHHNFYGARVDASSVESVVAKQKYNSTFASFTSEKQKLAKAYVVGEQNE